jgi:hypothetical protein
MDNSILQVMEEPWVVETSYLNLGRLPLLAFLCRWAPYVECFLCNAQLNDPKEICTCAEQKTIYMACALFFFGHGHGRAC